MTLLTLTLVLIAILIVRVAYIALQVRNIDRYWYDLERRGLQFQIARILGVGTTIGFVACAIVAMWNLDPQLHWLRRYGTIFVAWFGVSLLGKLSPHRFPRTNSPQLFAEAQASLISHVVTAFVGGLVMTGLAAIYSAIRG